MGDFALESVGVHAGTEELWLPPIILIPVLFGGLLLLTQGSAVAPFIYNYFFEPARFPVVPSPPDKPTMSFLYLVAPAVCRSHPLLPAFMEGRGGPSRPEHPAKSA